jgi:hypothetical protein
LRETDPQVPGTGLDHYGPRLDCPGTHRLSKDM